MPTVIRASHLAKRYGDTPALRDVSFEVEEGEIFGIIGPNGSGKTTTVESLQGLRTLDGGSVSVLGLDPATDTHRLRRRIGSQLQGAALPDKMKVWEALDLFASLSGEDREWEGLLTDWGLASKREARFASLSGGQQQRLFVALALVSDPALVFLDEMTTGLDPVSRRVAWDLLRRIRGRGTTVVLVTHFLDEAETLCDRLVVIDHGRVVAEGSPAELIDRHGGSVTVSFTLDTDDAPWLAQVPFVADWELDRGRCHVKGDGPVLAHVASALLAHGHAPRDLRQERTTLEDVFLALTSAERGDA